MRNTEKQIHSTHFPVADAHMQMHSQHAGDFTVADEEHTGDFSVANKQHTGDFTAADEEHTGDFTVAHG